MSPQNKIEEAYRLVDAGCRALNADEEAEGSRLMWEATRAAISAIAEPRGWSHETYEDVYKVLRRLDAEARNNGIGYPERPGTPYTTEFVIADSYARRTMDPFEYFDAPEDARWTSWEFKDRQVYMKPFIARLAKVALGDGKTP